MMLQNVDKIPAYERMHILVVVNDIENSPYLNNTQKEIILNKLQVIVDVWTKPELFV